MADQAVNPNALGAPASGFGQTVSFAFDPVGQAPTLNPATSGGPRGGVSGGSPNRLASTDVRLDTSPNPTMALLFKAGEALLAPKIEEQRNEQYIAGMQQAMEGAAIKDVVDQQPWYARIFGDTPAMEGMRAYTVSSKVNETMATQLANMDSLQKLNPQEAAKHFSGLLKGNLTGDSSTDMLIAKTMTDQMPGLMKAQAKSHYGYVQKQAMSALSGNMTTAAAGLQQAGEAYSSDTIDDADMNARKQAFLASIMPPAGINEESYTKTLATNLKVMADKGQFHALNVVRDSGGFGALTAEQQRAVEGAIEGASRRQKDKYTWDFGKQIAELRSDAANPPDGMTPQMIADRYKEMNAKFTKLTGNPSGLFTPDEMSNSLAGTLNYIKNEEKAAIRRADTLGSKTSKAEEKAAAAAEQAQAVSSAIANGDVQLARMMTKATNDEIDLEAYKQIKENPKGADFVIRQNWQKSGYVNPILQEQYLAPLRGAEGRDAPDAGFLAAVSIYEQMKQGDGGAGIAAAYFKDYAPKLERFSRMYANDPANVGAAYTSAMDRTGVLKPEPLNHKALAKLTADVSKVTNTRVPSWLGGKQNLRPDALDAVAAIAAGNVEEWRGAGLTDSESLERGIAGAISAGRLELIGGYAIRNSDTGKGTPIRELMSSKGGQFNYVPAGQEDAYFEGFLKDQLKVPQAGTTQISRAGQDATGSPRFMGTVQTADGPTIFTFSAHQLQDYASTRTKRETAAPLVPAYQAGPDLGYARIEAYHKAQGIAREAAKQADANKKRELKQP